MRNLTKHRKEFARAIADGNFEASDGGILFPKQGLHAVGTYFHTVNGEDLQIDKNLIPDQGILSILNVYFGATAKIPAWYLALFAGAVNPTNTLTAANFSATLTEIVSNAEGYSQLTRPQFTTAPAAGNVIGNLAAKALFSIVSTTSIIVNGGALLSDNTKGGTAGVLASAARFANARQIFNGDAFELGYTVTLTG